MSDTFKPRVREYTQDERVAMHFEPGVPVAEKVARLIQTHAIEIDRYQEAAVVHPEMSDHFNGLIAATNTYYGTALEQTFIPASEAASELVA
jgi:hypothetical protein